MTESCDMHLTWEHGKQSKVIGKAARKVEHKLEHVFGSTRSHVRSESTSCATISTSGVSLGGIMSFSPAHQPSNKCQRYSVFDEDIAGSRHKLQVQLQGLGRMNSCLQSPILGVYHQNIQRAKKNIG